LCVKKKENKTIISIYLNFAKLPSFKISTKSARKIPKKYLQKVYSILSKYLDPTVV
jgi:hypothetical protein